MLANVKNSLLEAIHQKRRKNDQGSMAAWSLFREAGALLDAEEAEAEKRLDIIKTEIVGVVERDSRGVSSKPVVSWNRFQKMLTDDPRSASSSTSDCEKAVSTHQADSRKVYTAEFPRSIHH